MKTIGLKHQLIGYRYTYGIYRSLVFDMYLYSDRILIFITKMPNLDKIFLTFFWRRKHIALPMKIVIQNDSCQIELLHLIQLSICFMVAFDQMKPFQQSVLD